MGGPVALFRRRRRADPVAPLADDGSLTTVGRAAAVSVDGSVDADAIEAIAESGVDLSAPVLLRHVLLVHDPAAAEALHAAVAADGYDVAPLDTHDGGWTWIVRATETAVLTPLHAARARARFASLASRHGAEYEGWEAAAPPGG